jgi:short-subunit dehydrogenase
MKRNRLFPDRYGPWALILGASEGLGAAFAQALAGRGMNLLLVARRGELLARLADSCRQRFGVEALCLAADLAAPGFTERLQAAAEGLELGVVVYNAAYAPVGGFLSVEAEDLSRVIEVNVRAPVLILRSLLPSMAARGRGAVILMSSLASGQGTPRIATYAASKAFNRILAEGLWFELKDSGIDAIACCAGAIRTPGYASAGGREAPGARDPAFVAERAIRSLGHGPIAIPGFVNAAAAWVMGRLLPRRAAIGLMAGSTSGLRQPPSSRGERA